MEIQKFRILRTNPDINWSIPCSGATDLWPLNTSTNCAGTMIYDANFSEIMGFITSNSNFPDKLKDCSITNPGVIVDDSSFVIDPNFCSNIGGNKYILFKGLNLIYNGSPVSGSYNELSSVIEGFHTGTTTSLLPNTIACTCVNQLGQDLNKLSIFVSQDYNDIGHYDVWDGNIGQQDTFGNFILSATSSSGYQVTTYRTTDIAYHSGVKDSIFTIDWGDGTVVDYGATSYQETHTYATGIQKQYKVIVTQDTPWGSKSVTNVITIPHFTYPVIFNQPYTPPTSGGPGSGMTEQEVILTGLGTQTNPGGGLSKAYHGIYGSASTLNYFPLDSATDIDQFSGLTFGPSSVFGIPCYTVSGITDSMLGNFQTYTTASTVNLPPGYQSGVLVPIGGDVLNPLTNTFETGVYGSIIYATPAVTAYTISSSYGASGGYANGDTPINFWDFTNGITIFEAESCGLDKRTFGALECIDCPDDDCMWCQFKDEYIDRTDNTSHQIPSTNIMGLWDTTIQYSFGDIVYDITWNACCCYVNVGGNPDTIVGISPSSMMEGVWSGIHMWEACNDECVSCTEGTQSPCNDTTLTHAYPDATSIPAGKASYYDTLTSYLEGDYVKGGNGNCYSATSNSTGVQPTGSTTNWDYVGCVSWDCPTDTNASDCVMISGKTLTSSMTYGGCKYNFDSNFCFASKWTCNLPLFQCNGCYEIFAGDALYNGPNTYLSHLDCLPTCSPPAWSCATPTAINCCVSYSCLYASDYISNVWQATQDHGTTDPITLSGHGLFIAPIFSVGNCTDDCCIYSSFTWNCEQGCISQNSTGGYSTFNECLLASNTDTNLNDNIGEINPATESVYISDGTGVYDAIFNNIPCAWSCGTITEIYNPMPDDPVGLGTYLSPCEPCYELGCGVDNVEEGCVSICSASTNCYVCDCLSVPNCGLVVECPTFTDITEDSYGPNEGVDTGIYLTLTPGTYSDFDLGYGPLFTYSSNTACTESCGCNGFDCAVYSTDSVQYDPSDPQRSVGLGCKAWSWLELYQNNYTWSANNPDGTAYTTFNDCCVANPGCCDASCIDCFRYPNNCNEPAFPIITSPTYPCQYFDMDSTPYPYPLYFSTEDFDYPILSCQNNLLTMPNGDIVCEMYQDCECACLSLTTSWINTYHFPGTTGLTLNHTGEWDEVLFDNLNQPIQHSYESGDTVTHEQPVAYSSPCCYICACVEGVGSLASGGLTDCNGFEPGTGVNTNGQNNCWIDCGSGESLPGALCPDCTPSPNDTWECDGSGLGCVPSTCNYSPVGPAANWATEMNCYITSNCGNQCDFGCGCDTVQELSVCVMLQDVLNYNLGNPNNFNTDIFPIPVNYNSSSLIECQDILDLPSDCCSSVGTVYECDSFLECSDDPSTNITGLGRGCYPLNPGDAGYATASFTDGNLTDPFGTVHASAYDHCLAACTWECTNNQGCGFQSYSTNVVANSAYDCYVQYGGCDDCNETYFCYSGTNFGALSIIPASDIASLNGGSGPLPNEEGAASFGQGGVSYDNGGFGFGNEILAQDYCRFKCNSDPTSCECVLVPNDVISGAISFVECGIQTPNCCFAEWWCEPVFGCKGYLTHQLLSDGGASNGESPDGAPSQQAAGPYYQIGAVPLSDTTGNPGTGEAGCQEYCGYVCGDGWELYLAECQCSFIHNEPDASMYNIPYMGDGVAVQSQPGGYANSSDCIMASIGVTIGNIGCCDCYNCIQATIVNGGLPYDTATPVHDVLNGETTWSITGIVTVASDIGATNPGVWDGSFGTSYVSGDAVVYDGTNSECCYIYNGCCDPNQMDCTSMPNLVCGGSYFPPNFSTDPSTVWLEYVTMLQAANPVTQLSGQFGLPSFVNVAFIGMITVDWNFGQGANGMNLDGTPTGTAILSTDIWTAGPTWVPCDQGCPQP